MNSYPPYKTLVSLILIALAIGVYHLLVPENQEKAGWFSNTTVSPALVNAVPVIARTTRKGPDVPVSTETTVRQPEVEVVRPPDQLLQYPQDGLLDGFYKVLKEYSEQKRDRISILHFGDSQLEEDRITMYLRSRFSQQWPHAPGQTAIRIDNLPIRGNAGINIHEYGGVSLEEIWRMARPDLLIFQFGINVVRAKTRDFRYYTRALVKQISVFRALDPTIPVIMIGVSDMASRTNESIESFSTVPYIRDAQYEAARQGAVVFWDLYSMMGGRGSASKWYMSDPPRIREDLTHFSFWGGKIIADQLFDAIYWDYKQWLIRN